MHRPDSGGLPTVPSPGPAQTYPVCYTCTGVAEAAGEACTAAAGADKALVSVAQVSLADASL